MTTGTIPTVRVTDAFGGAARSICTRGVVPDVLVAVVLSTVMRAVRCCFGGGSALGFELMPCDVVLADFNPSSSPQFVRFAYGARDASVEEDAFRKGRRDERRVLEAALSRSNRIAGVRDKPLGGIVECGAGSEERLHASRAKEVRLVLERTLEEVDGIP